MSTSATVRSSVAQRRLGAILAQQRCVERSSAAQTVWGISDVQCSCFHFWQGLGDQFRSAAGFGATIAQQRCVERNSVCTAWDISDV
jgi:hypothetical protein